MTTPAGRPELCEGCTELRCESARFACTSKGCCCDAQHAYDAGRKALAAEVLAMLPDSTSGRTRRGLAILLEDVRVGCMEAAK